MANVSQERRDRMLSFLKKLREANQDDNEQLIAINEIEQALNEKKYGLVWEEHTEQVDDLAKNHILLFREDKNKQITADESMPYNFLLEGDNLHSLRLLEKTHAGKINVIYIDPPYNTGNNDFIYNDKIVDKNDSYSHSKWLSFMSKRLRIARRLLSDRGVIFISIDDNEQAQLKLLCDEIFSEYNFITDVIWKHTEQSKNDERFFAKMYNHTLVYTKNIDKIHKFFLNRTDEDNKNYRNPDNDLNGAWRPGDVRSPSLRETLKYNIIAPDGTIIEPPNNGWRWAEKTMLKKIETGEVIFKADNTGIIRKIYLKNQEGRIAENIWANGEGGTTRSATEMLKNIFDGVSPFDTPKPIELILRILELYRLKDASVLDFFAGSGTVGHAVTQLNKIDGGNRKYILCTNNENNICEEVTYQRLKNIQDELPHNLKYFKTGLIEKIEDIPLADELLNHIKPLVELENACNLNHSSIHIFLDEEEFDEFMDSDDKLGITKIFLASDILLSAEQECILVELNCDIIRIPEYYYRDELIDSGDI